MDISNSWDWNTGKREIAQFGGWPASFDWVEEPYVSPDGEKIAAVVKTGEMEFSVCVNGSAWENTFDKVWYLRFAPDGRLTGIVSDTGQWTLAVDGTPWEEQYDYVWDTQFTRDGQTIVCAVQQGMKYMLVNNGTPWENTFANIGHKAMSFDGKRTAGVVQTVEFNEGDIFKFQEGCFTVAVDGTPWERNFLNVWGLAFSADNQHVAGEVRTTLYDYTIAVDGQAWPTSYPSIWQPCFNPLDGSVVAPAKVAGAWTMVRDGQSFWQGRYTQLWHQMFSPDGKRLGAIASPRYGHWTVAIDDKPWGRTFEDFVTDACFSPDSSRAACIGVTGKRYHICVDGQAWREGYDMAWAPVFSPDSQHVAAKVEKNGRFTLVVDGKPLKETYTKVWEPAFSPDSQSVLLRALEGDGPDAVFTRTVIPLNDILG
jgi:hypothetical protein